MKETTSIALFSTSGGRHTNRRHSDNSPPTELPASLSADKSTTIHSFGLSPSPRPIRPRPPIATTSSSSSGGAGIPRPESPTTSTHSSNYQRVPSPPAVAAAGTSNDDGRARGGGHSRQVSSVDTTPSVGRGHHRQVSSLDSTAEGAVGGEEEDSEHAAPVRGQRGVDVVSPEPDPTTTAQPLGDSVGPATLGTVREGEVQGPGQKTTRRQSSFGEVFDK